MGRRVCDVCGTDCHPSRAHLPLHDDYPFAIQVPQPPPPTPRRARRRSANRQRPTESHQRNVEDR